MTTTVIGATGRIGSAVAQRLRDAAHTVRVLASCSADGTDARP
jgi:nucleoside-diphosphate-sugar epimerase